MLASSLCSTLEHYLLLLTLCVVHARGQHRPLRPMIGCGRCCRWMLPALSTRRCGLPFPCPPVVDFGLAANSSRPLAPSPPGSRAFSAREGFGDSQAQVDRRETGGETTTTTTTAMPSDRRCSVPGILSPGSLAHIRHAHIGLTFSLRGAAFRLRPRHHRDALLLEIRWHISPRQSVARSGYGLLDEETYDARINAMNFASERTWER